MKLLYWMAPGESSSGPDLRDARFEVIPVPADRQPSYWLTDHEAQGVLLPPDHPEPGVALRFAANHRLPIYVLQESGDQADGQAIVLGPSSGEPALAGDLMRSLFEHSLDAMIIADAGGRYLEVNPAACELFGRSREQLVGGYPTDFVVPEENPAELWDRFRRDGQMSGEVRIIHADGTIRVAEYRAMANFVPGRNLSILRDATERHRMIAALMESRKMEALGRLAGRMAHEFNNLLTVINGYADILARGPQDRAQVSEYGGAILAAGERAAELTRRLNDIQRHPIPLPQVFDVNTRISRIAAELEELAGVPSRLTLALSSTPAVVRTDPTALEALCRGLVANAADAIRSGGSIRVQTGTQTGPEGGNFVVVDVIDTGSGMHPEVRSRAFEPFFSTKSSPRHLGLGLTRAYTIIEQSGGSIEIESAPGQGTLVRLLLPQAPAKQPAGTRTIPLEPFTPPAGQGRILVAEDEDSVRQLVCMTLTRFGYEVIEANSASAALSLLQDQIDKVDLILTDVMMPGMNGIELSREVRRKRPDLPVVYMSGYTEHTDLEPVRPGRKPILVRKPFGAAELCGVVNSVLENS